jgi:hypothetical protein
VETQGVELDHVVESTHGHEVLAVVEREAPDPRPPGPPQRLVEQAVGVLRLSRAGEVRLVEVHRIDVSGLDELGEVHHLASVAGSGLDLILSSTT